MVATDDIGELKELVLTLLARIEQLEVENAVLQAENVQLRARLAQNSTNSHKPPASDGLLKKPLSRTALIKPALPKTLGKKQGGQLGHGGKTLEMVEYPDAIHHHVATHCGQCGLRLSGKGQVIARRQVFDLPQPRLWVEEHQVMAHPCTCGCVQLGQFPAHITAPVQYGPRIHAQSVLLNVDYRVPFAKVSQLWTDLTGYSYNPATLIHTQTRLYAQLAPLEEVIKGQLINASVCHFDETGIRVGGKLAWLHVASTADYTHLFVHPNRGQLAFKAPQSVFMACTNWLVHDCWSSYFAAGQGRHALCGAHLLRELQAQIDQGRSWARALHEYLLALYQATRQGPLPANERRSWHDLYRQVCEQGLAEEPPALVFFRKNGRRNRARSSSGRNLLNRLVAHEWAVLAFGFEAGVPFSNNQAERDLRPAKIKQKVSGGFRTGSGAAVYARLAGFISTMRKQHANVVEQLANVLSDSFQWAT